MSSELDGRHILITGGSTGIGLAAAQARRGTAEELAETVGFLLSDRASHVTAQYIAVDGGILGTLGPQ